MARIIVFDVNETLLDVSALQPLFQLAFGDAGILKEWFSLLLLHSEVATLAGPYFDFATLAGATLEMTAASKGESISKANKQDILEGMLSLPPHPDVKPALTRLHGAGLRLVTLTNSSQRAADEQLKNAGISSFFERSFSVDSIRRYKPAPESYQMVASQMHVRTGDLRLVAAHAWDIVGAAQAGCATAFVTRPGKVPFPLLQPDVSASDLSGIAQEIVKRDSDRP